MEICSKQEAQKVSDEKRIYVRKSQEKIFWKIKHGNKSFVKKSQFSEVLEQNVTGKKFKVLDSCDFFP